MAKHRQRAREISSLGFSLGIHAGVLVMGSIIWVATSTPPPPEPVQVELLRLPPPTAPVEGQAPSSPAEDPAAIKAVEDPENPSFERSLATASQGREAQHQKRNAESAKQPGPSVEYQLRVAGPDPASPAPSIISRWEPAADLNVVDRDDPDQGQLTFAMAGVGTHQASSQTRLRPERNPDDLPFHVHDHGSGVLKRLMPSLPKPATLTPGGSRKALLELIQARIDAVAPLVHRTSAGCRNASGLARIRFVIDTNGYPIGYQILDSSGNGCLDGQIDTLLHLAEPYPFVAGWVPVRVRFTL